MLINYKKVILLAAFIFIGISAFAQSQRKFIDSGAVKNQFDYLIKKSNRYQEYKVVKTDWLLQLKGNVADSLAASKKEITNNRSTISLQKSTIKNLQIQLKKADENIQQLTNTKNSISFFGLLLDKTVFNFLILLVVVTLVVLLIIFITKFKHSNTVTEQSIQRLKETEEEFNTHRQTAIKREQKVLRQLQDERNKNSKD